MYIVTAIDRVDVSSRVLTEADEVGLKLDFRAAVWAWFHEHENDTIAHIFIFKVRLADIKHIIVQMIGPDPTGA